MFKSHILKNKNNPNLCGRRYSLYTLFFLSVANAEDILTIYCKPILPFESEGRRLTSVSYLIRPSEDGEGENARREPSVENILI